MKEVYRKKTKRRIEMVVKRTGYLYVEVERPQRREMVTRRYEPTSASLERVKKLVCYGLGPNTRWLAGNEVVAVGYWHYF